MSLEADALDAALADGGAGDYTFLEFDEEGDDVATTASSKQYEQHHQQPPPQRQRQQQPRRQQRREQQQQQQQQSSSDAKAAWYEEAIGGVAAHDQGQRQGDADALASGVEGLSLGDGAKGEGAGGGDGETLAEEDLPEWACAYCGISDPACVARCAATGKWFCNARCGTLPASCLVYHLVRSRNKEVVLHKESPLGETVLECYITGNRNVFSLGFVPVTTEGENTVALISRDPDVFASGRKEFDWDMDQWQPIVQNKKFLPWLIKEPSAHDVVRARHLSAAQVNRLEELWKREPEATLEDLERPGMDDDAEPVQTRYEDSVSYMRIYEALVGLEAEHDRLTKESQAKSDVTVQWDVSLNRRQIANFYYPQEDHEAKLAVGQEMALRPPKREDDGASAGGGAANESGKRGKGRSKRAKCAEYNGGGNAKETTYVGRVVKVVPETGEVALELRGRNIPTSVTLGYGVEVCWKAISYDRMRTALKLFANDETSVSGFIYHTLLGHEPEPQPMRGKPPAHISAPGLPELNHSQAEAVRTVLSRPFSLIQGPPGTGKTVTSATVVYHMSKLNQGQVLVCAPSNVAVDQLTEKVAATGLKVVRLVAKSREDMTSSVEHLTLHYQVTNLGTREQLTKLSQLKMETGELSEKDEKKYRSLLKAAEREVLQAADVICCTCVGAGDARLTNFRFRHVLVDENTQATEPECLIPLVSGAKQAVLVGDHCQLGPVIVCKQAARAGLNQSLFERCIRMGIRPIRLEVQYRMHPALSEFPSNTFYEGSLQNGVGASERVREEVDFPWPSVECPLMFYSQMGQEEISSSGTSYLNRMEATNVERIVTTFLRCGVHPSQLGVITPYEGQRAYVVATLLRSGALRQVLYEQVEVASVDAFQGREKDYIILSCVRSNEHNGVGFLNDPRRLNVALTRSKYGTVVLGNPKMLSSQPLWHSLISHCRDRQALVEGSLSNLKQCLVPLSTPKQFRFGNQLGQRGDGQGGRRHPHNPDENDPDYRRGFAQLPRNSRANGGGPQHHQYQPPKATDPQSPLAPLGPTPVPGGYNYAPRAPANPYAISAQGVNNHNAAAFFGGSNVFMQPTDGGLGGVPVPPHR